MPSSQQGVGRQRGGSTMLVVFGDGGGALGGGLGFWREGGGRAAGTYNCVMFVGRFVAGCLFVWVSAGLSLRLAGCRLFVCPPGCLSSCLCSGVCLSLSVPLAPRTVPHTWSVLVGKPVGSTHVEPTGRSVLHM